MKKIINGKMYNTETAEHIGRYWDGSCGDFRHYVEDLYRKKTGEFFLYGCGGPMTKYATSCDDGCLTGGDGFTPLTEHEARSWCEEYLDVDKYIEVFGEPEE